MLSEYGPWLRSTRERLDDEEIASACRTQTPTAHAGLFTKNRFAVNLNDDTVTCPANITVSIRRVADGGAARFAEHLHELSAA